MTKRRRSSLCLSPPPLKKNPKKMLMCQKINRMVAKKISTPEPRNLSKKKKKRALKTPQLMTKQMPKLTLRTKKR